MGNGKWEIGNANRYHVLFWVPTFYLSYEKNNVFRFYGERNKKKNPEALQLRGF